MNEAPKYKIGDIVERKFVSLRDDEVKARYMILGYSRLTNDYDTIYVQQSSGWDGTIQHRPVDADFLDNSGGKLIGKNDLSLLKDILDPHFIDEFTEDVKHTMEFLESEKYREIIQAFEY